MRQFTQIEPIRQGSLRLAATLEVFTESIESINHSLANLELIPGMEDVTVLGAVFHIAPVSGETTGELEPLFYRTALHIRQGAGIAVDRPGSGDWFAKIALERHPSGIRFVPYAELSPPLQATVHFELSAMLGVLYGVLRDHLTRMA